MDCVSPAIVSIEHEWKLYTPRACCVYPAFNATHFVSPTHKGYGWAGLILFRLLLFFLFLSYVRAHLAHFMTLLESHPFCMRVARLAAWPALTMRHTTVRGRQKAMRACGGRKPANLAHKGVSRGGAAERLFCRSLSIEPIPLLLRRYESVQVGSSGHPLNKPFLCDDSSLTVARQRNKPTMLQRATCDQQPTATAVC